MFTGEFSVTQNIGDITSITLHDDSDYSSEPPSSFNGRKVYVILSDGSFIKPPNSSTDYWSWAVSSGNDILEMDNIFKKSVALEIRVEWEPIVPDPLSVYVATNSYVTLEDVKNRAYGQAQKLASNPALINDGQFRGALYSVFCEINNAQNAVTIASDITNSQLALDRAYYKLDHEKMFF